MWPAHLERDLIVLWHKTANEKCGLKRLVVLEHPYSLQQLSDHGMAPTVFGIVSIYGRFSCG